MIDRHCRGDLPHDLVEDLKEILHPRLVTDDLLREVADALGSYGGRHAEASGRADHLQKIAAARRLITSATALQRDMRRADAAFPIRGKRFLSARWEPLGPHLQVTIDSLNAWLQLHDDGPRRRGNPHKGQGVFRVCVLDALQRAGFAITNPKGQAAQVMARLLEEIDRLDGVPPRERSDFSGTQWARWVEQVQFNKALIADHERSRLSLDTWARTRYPVFAREWAAAHKATTRKRG